MIPKSNFPGLFMKSYDFEQFEVLEQKEDPYFPGVFLLHIRFCKTQDHGLCIYDTNNQRFIEEPGDLDDYGDTPEKLQTQHGFTQW
jgi:hypothetical protein